MEMRKVIIQFPNETDEDVKTCRCVDLKKLTDKMEVMLTKSYHEKKIKLPEFIKAKIYKLCIT